MTCQTRNQQAFYEAIAYFKDKVVLKPGNYKALAVEAKAKAFSVSGVLEDLYAAIDRSIAQGEGFADFKKSVRDIMQRRGGEGLKPHRHERGSGARAQPVDPRQRGKRRGIKRGLQSGSRKWLTC